MASIYKIEWQIHKRYPLPGEQPPRAGNASLYAPGQSFRDSAPAWVPTDQTDLGEINRADQYRKPIQSAFVLALSQHPKDLLAVLNNNISSVQAGGLWPGEEIEILSVRTAVPDSNQLVLS